ncbi:MAG: MinD/ParA family protein [Pseudomonadota bacterium]
MSGENPIQVVAVTGGKGGVGKTSMSVNLGLALNAMGKRVVLLDADMGLANVDVLLGIRAEHTIADVMEGRCELRDILVTTDQGLHVIPASSGIRAVTNMSQQQHGGLISAFSELGDDMDVLLIDTAAGIADNVVSFVSASREVIIVVCDEPSSMTDAYALIKVLNRDCDKRDFRIVANMTRSATEGERLFRKFAAAATRFLDVNLQYAGDVPWDDTLRKATQRQVPLLEGWPGSPAARAYQRLAREVADWPLRSGPSGHMEFFVERLIRDTA